MNLSPRQLTITNALRASKHSNKRIADNAGVDFLTLWHWKTRKHEPSDPLYEAVMQSIYELDKVPADNRIDWNSRIGELIPLRGQGMNHHQIARQLNASQSSIRRVCMRHGI